MREFKRGDVFTAYIPEFKFTQRAPAPGFVIKGSHMVVMLHDSNHKDLPSRSAQVVPITSAKAAASRENIFESYVGIRKDDGHSFLTKDESYISAHQSFPINREWLSLRPVGRITDEKMLEVDMQLIRTHGLINTVHKLMVDYHADKLREFEANMRETAAGREDDRGIDR